MNFPITFKIKIYQRSFDTEDLERLEDDLARLLSLYSYRAEIEDTVTGNITHAPFRPDGEATPGLVDYQY